MQQLKDIHGVPTILRALRVLSIRVRSAKETAGLAGPLDEVRADLAKKDDAWQAAVDERTAASAEGKWRDLDEDAAVLDYSRDALALVKGVRTDARFRQLFPTAASDVVQSTAAAQERFVEALLGQTPLAGLEGCHAQLKEAHLALKKAIADRDALYAPEQHAKTARDIAADNARRLYNRTFSLASVALDNPRRVESFFPILRGRAEADVLDTPGETPED